MEPTKIALVIFGLPRNSTLTTPSIESNVINPLSNGAQIRLFHYLYAEDEINNPWTGERCNLPQSNYHWFQRSEGLIEPPTQALASFDLAELKCYGDAWNTNFVTLRNVMLQLRAMQYAKKLADSWSPNAYVFLRADLLYEDKFEIDAITTIALSQAPKCILPRWQWWDGFNDRFAICNRAAASAYSDRIELASTYCKVTNLPLHTERLLHFALKRAGVQVIPVTWRAARVRANGHIVTEDYSNDATTTRSVRRTIRRLLVKTGLHRP